MVHDTGTWTLASCQVDQTMPVTSLDQTGTSAGQETFHVLVQCGKMAVAEPVVAIQKADNQRLKKPVPRPNTPLLRVLYRQGGNSHNDDANSLVAWQRW